MPIKKINCIAFNELGTQTSTVLTINFPDKLLLSIFVFSVAAPALASADLLVEAIRTCGAALGKENAA